MFQNLLQVNQGKVQGFLSREEEICRGDRCLEFANYRKINKVCLGKESLELSLLMFSQGEVKTRPVDISQTYFHPSAREAVSLRVLRTAFGKGKNVQVISASGKQPPFPEAIGTQR